MKRIKPKQNLKIFLTVLWACRISVPNQVLNLDHSSENPES